MNNQTKFITHSLATPLTTILINSELAIENYIQSGNSKKNQQFYLKNILLSARHASSILKLSDSNISANNYLQEQFSIKTALLEILSVVYLKPQQLLLKYLNISDHLKLKGKKTLMQESIICLVNNAFESYSYGHTQQIVTLSATQEKNSLSITISDGGSGIKKDKNSLVLRDGYSTKNNHSGLGLYFVEKTIKKEFGGQFDISSQGKRGTVAKIVVPI